MSSLLTKVTLLATASLALAAPTTQQKGFSVPRIPTGRRNTPAALHQHTANKFAADAGTTGSVSATPQPYDSEYLCPVTVGQSSLSLDFDTGSSDLWVFSNQTPNPGSHSTYDTSTGTLQQGETWQISYGDGSGASGIVYTDSVTVGGATVTSQAVEAATSVSSEFTSGVPDGLLGLGYDDGNTCSPNACQTFFGNLMGSTPSPLFTADLQPNGGSYDFGYIDSSKYSGDITYVSVLQQNPAYWDFTAGTNSIDNSDIGYSIMDTGTSLWYLPQSTVQSYYSSISGSSTTQGLYTLPCSGGNADVSVQIGGTTFTVPGSALINQPLNDGSGNCLGSIQYMSGIPGSIFGDAFMDNFFVVFDLGNNQLGVANQ